VAKVSASLLPARTGARRRRCGARREVGRAFGMSTSSPRSCRAPNGSPWGCS